MKTCTKCNIEKELGAYHFCKKEKSGLKSACKNCRNTLNRAYKEANKELMHAEGKAYRLKNKDSIRKRGKIYHAKNRDSINERHKLTYDPETSKKYRLKNKDILNLKRKVRRKTNTLFGLSNRVSTAIRASFKNKGYTKTSKTAQILGCSFEELYKHLKNTFEINYGIPFSQVDIKLLQIDHVIPLASAETEKAIIKLNHYTNLQYLFAWDNREKADKLDWKLI